MSGPLEVGSTHGALEGERGDQPVDDERLGQLPEAPRNATGETLQASFMDPTPTGLAVGRLLDDGRAQPHRLVDDQIGHQRAEITSPGFPADPPPDCTIRAPSVDYPHLLPHQPEQPATTTRPHQQLDLGG